MKEKDFILKYANILLISDYKEDYKALKKYGFRKINHYKSIIEASKYFESHLEVLNKYNIIFERCQKRQLGSFNEKNQMYYFLWEMNRKNCLRINCHVVNTPKPTSIYLMNGKNYVDADYNFIFEEAVFYLQQKKEWFQGLIEQEIKNEKVNPNDEPMLDFIEKFDQLQAILKDYLYYNAQKYIKYSSDDLQVEKCEKGILVKNYDSGKLKGALILSEEKRENLRVFQVLHATKKGSLTKPLMVGIYTSVYDGLKGIPPKIGEKEKYLFRSIWVKAINRLEPAISCAKEERIDATSPEKQMQRRKKKYKN